jgi:hypothetical protein
MQITINNAEITGQGGDIHNATITGDAVITEPPVDGGDVHPSHPILLPPTSEDPNTFFVLCFCANPPPPHWEWIAFSPGDPPARPVPQPPPPEGEIPTTPGGIKPPPADGGWGYFPGYGWVYYPGASAPSPKAKKK